VVIGNSAMEGETIMKRIDHIIRAGVLAAAIGFATIGFAAPTDTKNKTAPIPATSPAAKTPSLGRVVVTPSAEQMAKIRRERRIIELGNRASVDQRTTSGRTAETGAL
jgi:hypothetical protein